MCFFIVYGISIYEKQTKFEININNDELFLLSLFQVKMQHIWHMYLAIKA
jgi:hypothetical protein